MNQKHKLIYEFAQAILLQDTYEANVSKALRSLGSDNEIVSLADPLRNVLNSLMLNLAGPELYEWLMWWIYETEHGTKDMCFTIDGTKYDPTKITLYRFLELVDASN